MPLITYKAIAAILIFITSMATVIYPLKAKQGIYRESFELGEALASGIFLGVAFFHLLPDAISLFQQLYGNMFFPMPEAVCLAGFVLLLFLERLSFSNSFLTPQMIIPYILALILIIHALIEGTALGMSPMTEALMIFIAIIAHKGSASFALCITLMRYQLPFLRIVLIMTFFSLMTPIGIGLGSFISLITHSEKGLLAAAILNAFAAGTFLYIATLHHIRFHQRIEEAHALLEFSFLMLGLIMMGLIAVWV